MILSIWSDAFSSLKEGILGDYLKGNFEVYKNLSEKYSHIKFHTNCPFTKQRNYVERRIKDIKALLGQVQIFSPNTKLALVPQEWDNLILLIESHLNNVPYKKDSLLTPSGILNPRQVARFYTIPESSLYHDSKLGELSRKLNDIRLTQLLEDSKLQVKKQQIREPKVGQSVWYYKNQDQKGLGIIFGVIHSRVGSDFLVDMSRGGQEKVSGIRLFLIYDKDNDNNDTDQN